MPRLVIMCPIPKKDVKSKEDPPINMEGFAIIVDRAKAAGLIVTAEGIRLWADGELKDFQPLLEGMDGWSIGILHTSRRNEEGK